jgi:periplasmic protein CpxP/Spy
MLAAPAPAAAEPNAGAHAKRSDPERAQARREHRSAKLKQAGIDDARAKQVLATMERADGERKPVMESLRAQGTELKRLVESKTTDEAAYSRALSSMRTSKTKLAQIRDRELDAVAKILKPSEQARLLGMLHQGKRGKPEARMERKGGHQRKS